MIFYVYIYLKNIYFVEESPDSFLSEADFVPRSQILTVQSALQVMYMSGWYGFQRTYSNHGQIC